MPGSGPWLRSLELDLRADVDPFAKAVAVIALEQEPPLEREGASEDVPFSVAPEEVYVDFVGLPVGLSARAGQFRQPFGVVNKSHPHDLPWTDTPLPIRTMLGDEGYSDVGALLSWHIPNGLTGLSAQAAVLRGSRFDAEDQVAAPQWLARAEWFHELGQWDWSLGASATGSRDEAVLGADLLLRWRENSWRSAVVLVEVLSDADHLGGYAALQVQPTRSLFLGLRTDLVDQDLLFGGYLSYYTTEFLRLRAGATTHNEQVLAHLQLTFVWGSHPIEPYWVNR